MAEMSPEPTGGEVSVWAYLFEPEEPEAVVADPFFKVVATAVWLAVSAIPSVLLIFYDVGLYAVLGVESSFFLLPLLWCACAGLMSPLYVRLLGIVVDVKVLPRPPRALHHLPAGCAKLVDEAAAIREDLGDVDAALLRAWTLANEVEQAPTEVRLALEAAGATLEPVRGLISTRATEGRRASRVRLRERLAAALTSFEAALEQPRRGGFR